MRRPLRPSPNGEPLSLIEPRFTLGSLLQRIFLGSAGSLGSKKAVLFMDYASNAFDRELLFRRVASSRQPALLLFDGLSSFAFLWREGMKRRGTNAFSIYLSHDYEPDFVVNRYLAAMARRKIDFALSNSSMVIAASRRDKLRYLKHGKLEDDRIIVYPNIYPPANSNSLLPEKSRRFTIAVVESRWSGPKGALRDAAELARALRLLPAHAPVRVLALGPTLPGFLRRILGGGFEVESFDHVTAREEFLRVLSGAHVGLNQGRWLGGTNVKKYDYSLAGVVVLSNSAGARGEIMPHEYVFADEADLASKLTELLERDPEELEKMGLQNRRAALASAGEAASALGEAVRRLERPERVDV